MVDLSTIYLGVVFYNFWMYFFLMISQVFLFIFLPAFVAAWSIREVIMRIFVYYD